MDERRCHRCPRLPPGVLLVSPKFNDNAFRGFEAACALQGAKCLEPPLGPITLAAMLPARWNLRLIDRNADHELTDADVSAADLVMAAGTLLPAGDDDACEAGPLSAVA